MNQSYVQQTWGRWDPLRVQQSGEMSSLDVDKMRVVDLRQVESYNRMPSLGRPHSQGAAKEAFTSADVRRR